MTDGLRNRKFHEILARTAAETTPTPSWGAGLARALQGGVAGLIERGDNASEMEANKWQAGLLGLQAAAQQPTPAGLAMALSGESGPAPQSTPLTTLVGNNPAALAPQPRGATMLPVAGTGDTVPLPKRNPLGALNPEFRSKFADLRTAAGDSGAYFDAPEQGSLGNVRSPQQQQALYAQGRTAPGPVVTGTTQSNHITGRALDVVPTNGTSEKQIGSVVSSLIANDPRFAGMRSGATFSNLYDPLHVELNKPQGQTQVASLANAGAPQQPLAMALQQPDDGAELPPKAQPVQLQGPPQFAQAQPQGQSPFGPQPPQKVAQATDASAALRAQIQQGLTSPNEIIRRRAEAYAASIVNKQLEGDKPTDEIREYNLYKLQGGTKNFFDYKADLKKAGSTQVIQTMDQKAESAFDTKAGQLQAERFDSIVKDGLSAKAMISDMTALTDIGSRITTGKTAEIAAALGPYAEMLGVKVDGLGDLQAYKAIVRKLAPQMRVPGSGATSDFEMRNFLEALPGLGKTPEGNATIGKVFTAIQEQKLAAADIASKVLNKEIPRSAGEKMLRDLPDPLALWKKNKGESAVAKPADAAPGGRSVDDLVTKYRSK